METAQKLVEISGLTKKYGEKTVLDNVSFSIGKNEIVGFLGPNGAGKSTTMNIITGYISASEGSARVAGFDILEEPEEVKRRVGYLPENPPLYPEKTVKEYLEFVYELKRVKAEKNEHIRDTMKLVGIESVADRLIKNLSKGYKQRVGIAQALIGDPELLILDEPTVGLDPRQIIEIRNVIKALGGNRTIIISTHILQEVSAVCDRVIIINGGRIAVDSPLAELSGINAEKCVITARCDRSRVKEILTGVEGIRRAAVETYTEEETRFTVEAEKGRDIRAALCAAFTGEGIMLTELTPERMSVEDIFIRIVNSDRKDYKNESDL